MIIGIREDPRIGIRLRPIFFLVEEHNTQPQLLETLKDKSFSDAPAIHHQKTLAGKL